MDSFLQFAHKHASIISVSALDSDQISNLQSDFIPLEYIKCCCKYELILFVFRYDIFADSPFFAGITPKNTTFEESTVLHLKRIHFTENTSFEERVRHLKDTLSRRR